MSIVTVIAVIAVAGYVIGRQLVGEPLRGKRVVALPLILTVIGIAELARTSRPVRGTDIAILALGAAVATGIGLAQGRATRLEARDGALWGQMPARTLWLWVTLAVSHGALMLVASGVGAHVAAGTAGVLLTLGVNRVGQALVVVPRAVRAGIPFAPERDGSTFLSGLIGPAAQHSRGVERVHPRTARSRSGERALQTVARATADWLATRHAS
jgi:hypothetical protein